FNCPHTGVALAVFLKLQQKKMFNPKDKIVVISTAHGLKFVEFKIGYHKSELDDVLPNYANRPIQLPNEYNAVVDTIDRNILK
ncbi:MAG: threonine synthase, partial [Thermodesulfobacteriota bacterium]